MNFPQIFMALALAAQTTVTSCAPEENSTFGDNSSKWANDNECDDRRFYGDGMARELDSADTGHDGHDCKSMFELGEVKFWNLEEARAQTQCDAIAYGNNSSKWSHDDECDDPRFEGPASADVVIRSDIGHDAKDCRAACRLGTVALRDY